MQKIIFGCICAMFLSLNLGVSLVAQPTNPDAGRSLLRGTAIACGGIEKFKSVHTLTYRGESTLYAASDSQRVSVETMKVFPAQMLTSIAFLGRKATEILDNERAYQIHDNNRKTLPRTDVARLKSQQWNDLVYILSHADDPTLKVEYMGENREEKFKVLRIQPANKDIPAFNLYIDADSLMPLHLVFAAPNAPVGQTSGIVQFRNFRTIQGLRLPTKVILRTNRVKLQETVYDIVVINDAIDDEIFTGQHE